MERGTAEWSLRSPNNRGPTADLDWRSLVLGRRLNQGPRLSVLGAADVGATGSELRVPGGVSTTAARQPAQFQPGAADVTS